MKTLPQVGQDGLIAIWRHLKRLGSFEVGSHLREPYSKLTTLMKPYGVARKPERTSMLAILLAAQLLMDRPLDTVQLWERQTARAVMFVSWSDLSRTMLPACSDLGMTVTSSYLADDSRKLGQTCHLHLTSSVDDVHNGTRSVASDHSIRFIQAQRPNPLASGVWLVTLAGIVTADTRPHLGVCSRQLEIETVLRLRWLIFLPVFP